MLVTNRFYRVVTKDGATTTGRLLNLDTFTVQMLDSNGAAALVRQVRSSRARLRRQSPMPSFKDTLTTQELADVVGYLVSLKGKVTP